MLIHDHLRKISGVSELEPHHGVEGFVRTERHELTCSGL